MAPGAQGAAVAGTQGMGVSAPMAAAVAEATVGLAMLVHTPKGGTLAMGAKSMIVAAGIPPASVVGALSATRLEGAAPKLHVIIAPVTT
jgi:hypothetical protein